MSRPSFRPRPLDIHKKLPIVKSVKDLDSDESVAVSRTVLHGHNVENEAVQSTPIKRGSEIPTPDFVVVESYERDYTRTFLQPPSYVRGRGARNETAEYVEYDLDDEDDDWLQQFNNERRLLSPERFEWMLFKLELLDHRARERAGGMPTTIGVPMPVLLQEDAAVEALRCQAPRLAVLPAIYDYWNSKRDRWQKPILRRLQLPPPVNDTNPFNVFRPREKAHRPHTRRMQRRENDVLSFEKLRQVRRNLEQARVLLRVIQKREEKKREVVECEANLQRVQITFKHDSQIDDEVLFSSSYAIMAQHSRKPFILKRDDGIASAQRSNFTVGTPDLVNGNVRMRPTGELTPPFTDGSMMLDHLDLSRRKGKRRRFPSQRGRATKRIAGIDSFEPVLLFTKPVDSERLTAAGIVPPLDPPRANGATQPPYCYRGRMGRGGRIIFDRWDPLNRTPIGCSSLSQISRSSSATRLDPPPPRLNLEKTDPLLSTISAADGNFDPNSKENLRTT